MFAELFKWQLASVLDNAVLMLSYLVTPFVRCNLKDNFKVELIYCPEFIVWLVTRKVINQRVLFCN